MQAQSDEIATLKNIIGQQQKQIDNITGVLLQLFVGVLFDRETQTETVEMYTDALHGYVRTTATTTPIVEQNYNITQQFEEFKKGIETIEGVTAVHSEDSYTDTKIPLQPEFRELPEEPNGNGNGICHDPAKDRSQPFSQSYKHCSRECYDSKELLNYENKGSCRKIVYYDGEYQGHTINGKKNGPGTMFWNNGDIYNGNWRNDKRNGCGKFESSEFVYEGDWKDDQMHGEGTITWYNGVDWTWMEGDVYEGEWVHNKMCGKGKMTYYIDLDVDQKNEYEGDFKDGQRHGSGTMRYSNGDVYKGNWAEGLRYGQGELKCKSGKIINSIWKNDEPAPRGGKWEYYI